MLQRSRPALTAFLLGGSVLCGAIPAARAQDTPQPPKVEASQIKEHWEVIGSDTKHVGTVDKVKGDTIELTKDDPAAGGTHHAIPLSWVGTAQAGKVVLKQTGEEAMAAWTATGRPQGDPKK
jgi:hypothetical protein